MGQPEFVPVASVRSSTVVREDEIVPASKGWFADRVAERIPGSSRFVGEGFGATGPDQGYALTLAKRFHGKLTLEAGENEHDVLIGCVQIAMARASVFGRAPVIHDLRLALNLFGFQSTASKELVAFRKDLFENAGHHYAVQRLIASRVPERTLLMTPEKVSVEVDAGMWQALLS